MYICICMYVNIYAYIYIYMYTYIYIYVCVCVSIDGASRAYSLKGSGSISRASLPLGQFRRKA